MNRAALMISLQIIVSRGWHLRGAEASSAFTQCGVDETRQEPLYLKPPGTVNFQEWVRVNS